MQPGDITLVDNRGYNSAQAADAFEIINLSFGGDQFILGEDQTE